MADQPASGYKDLAELLCVC